MIQDYLLNLIRFRFLFQFKPAFSQPLLSAPNFRPLIPEVSGSQSLLRLRLAVELMRKNIHFSLMSQPFWVTQFWYKPVSSIWFHKCKKLELDQQKKPSPYNLRIRTWDWLSFSDLFFYTRYLRPFLIGSHNMDHLLRIAQIIGFKNW